MNAANNEIKIALIRKGKHQYDLANMIGVHEGSLCRWLRVPLPTDLIQAIVEMIETDSTKDAKNIRNWLASVSIKSSSKEKAGKYRFNGTEYAERTLRSARNVFDERNNFEKLFLET